MDKGRVVKQKSLNLTMYFAKAAAHLTHLYKIHPAMRQCSGFILTTEIMIPYPKYLNREGKKGKEIIRASAEIFPYVCTPKF